MVSRDGQLFPPLTISPYGSYDATKGLFEWNLPKAHEGVSYIWESTDKAYLGNFSGTVVQPVKEVFLSETKLSWSKERIEKSMEKQSILMTFKTALPFIGKMSMLGIDYNLLSKRGSRNPEISR